MTTRLVIDTNVALDLLVFADPSVQLLHAALAEQRAQWLVTEVMRAEFVRVLSYPRVAPRLLVAGHAEAEVQHLFDRLTCVVDPAPVAPCRCADPDDQMFVDLAVQHGAWLLSKDAAVLALKRQLQGLGVAVSLPRAFGDGPLSPS